MSEISTKLRALSVGAVGIILACSGCSTTPAEDRAGLNPFDRYTNDFVSGDSDKDGVYDGCMRLTPYTNYSSRSQQAAVLKYDPSTKIMSVTPGYGDVLLVTGFDNDELNLSPVGQNSTNILDTYGCAHGPMIEATAK